MENEIMNLFISKLENCSDSFQQYAAFINDIEFFADQHTNIFSSETNVQRYKSIWFELETLNSCALSEWEEMQRSSEFLNVWKEKYKKDADKLLSKLRCFLATAVIHKEKCDICR